MQGYKEFFFSFFGLFLFFSFFFGFIDRLVDMTGNGFGGGGERHTAKGPSLGL